MTGSVVTLYPSTPPTARLSLSAAPLAGALATEDGVGESLTGQSFAVVPGAEQATKKSLAMPGELCHCHLVTFREYASTDQALCLAGTSWSPKHQPGIVGRASSEGMHNPSTRRL